MSTHANNSPSGAEGWMNCAHWASDSKGSAAAEAGTAKHEFTAMLLLGKEVAAGVESLDAPGYFYDEKTKPDVLLAVDNVLARIEQFKLRGAKSVEMLVEQRLGIGHITGEEGATGTSDVVLLITWPDGTLQCDVIDHKFGFREVSPVKNKQGRMYLLAAVEEFGVVGEFTKASFAVNQPQAYPSITDDEFGIDELREFAEQAGDAAERRRNPDAHPAVAGSHCDKSYCAKRATCRTHIAYLEDGVGADFDVIPAMSPSALVENTVTSAEGEVLSKRMRVVDILEGWIKAVRAEVETRLLAGEAVPGWKVVQGKKGNRAWTSKEDAEALLKTMRVKHDQMYDYSVISPTSAEKLAKAEVIGKRQWPKVQALITQSEGRPSVAPESDKRPALVMSAVANDFEDVTADDLT
jgi:uncharacterized protein (DUF2147 family)